MSLNRVGGSAKSPAAAIERRENVVPAKPFRPARSNGLSATHRANVKRQSWLSPKRNAIASSWWSKETSTNDAPLARNSSRASSTALLFPQSLNVMLPLEGGQRFGPNSGWTLASRKPDRPRWEYPCLSAHTLLDQEAGETRAERWTDSSLRDFRREACVHLFLGLVIA